MRISIPSWSSDSVAIVSATSSTRSCGVRSSVSGLAYSSMSASSRSSRATSALASSTRLPAPGGSRLEPVDVFEGEADGRQRVANLVHDAGGELSDAGEPGVLDQLDGATQADADQHPEIAQQRQMFATEIVGVTAGEHRHPLDRLAIADWQEDGITPTQFGQVAQEDVATRTRRPSP